MNTTNDRENVAGIEFPSVEGVAGALLNVKARIDADCDVRLQVYLDGNWMVRWGSSDYDLDHRGYWGAASISPDDEYSCLLDTAAALIDQAADAAACADD